MIAGGTSTTTLTCPKCAFLLHPEALAPRGRTGLVDCPACRSVLHVALFPAFSAPPERVSTSSGERAVEGESVCFFHPEKRADITCDRCGRFLCALCDVPFAGRHICPACLDASKMPELNNQRVDWDKLAATVGWLPILLSPMCFPFFFLAFATGPGAIALALLKWRGEGSLVHGRRRWLSIFGIVGGLLQIGGLGFMAWAIFNSSTRG
jgi:hypothetical protein